MCAGSECVLVSGMVGWCAWLALVCDIGVPVCVPSWCMPHRTNGSEA